MDFFNLKKEIKLAKVGGRAGIRNKISGERDEDIYEKAHRISHRGCVFVCSETLARFTYACWGGAESLDSLSSFAALLLLVGNIVYKVKVEKKKRGVGTAEPIVKQYRNDFVRVLGPYDLLELSVLNI